MKYTYTLNGFRRTYQGRPDVRFTCCHCGKLSLNLVSFSGVQDWITAPVFFLKKRVSSLLKKLTVNNSSCFFTILR
ncbi:hypothetical protein ArsFIN_45930 (plasmid) [Arsenophonus nasoniae]|uniref:Uncharacterized protein n=1 Tax=Arsenophonus nasoniae TaxID=638 RepID=A0A4P7LA16_9GAMM|nr:hypothetical protein ArsFIN_45930 [Arsenophonus nasoniae]